MKKLIVFLLVFFIASSPDFCQKQTNSHKSSVSLNFKPGLLNITELNIGFGLGDTQADYAKSFYGLTSVIGYGITKNLNAGIGSGLSFYNGGMLVPLFLDLRGIINLGKISAYAFGDGGLLFNFSESNYGNKILLNPGLGIQFPFGEKLFGNLGAGLFLQTTKGKEEHDSFINLKVGITYTFRK